MPASSAAAPFGVRGVTHLQSRRFADFVAENIGVERTSGEARHDFIGPWAGKVQAGRVGFPCGKADDAAIDETHIRLHHGVGDLNGSLRRDCVGVNEQSVKAGLHDVFGERLGCMGRTNADDDRALFAKFF
jgi:hypothetical protein